MTKDINEYINIYKTQLEKGDVQLAYEFLLKYVHSLKTQFSNLQTFPYSCGNVSPGYMDYTYFPFSDEGLRSKKLRFGIILNHYEMQFELWLMGQNANVQKEYWEKLKHTKWNQGRVTKPKYSVLETVLVENPGFCNLDALSSKIQKLTIAYAKEITAHI